MSPSNKNISRYRSSLCSSLKFNHDCDNENISGMKCEWNTKLSKCQKKDNKRKYIKMSRKKNNSSSKPIYTFKFDVSMQNDTHSIVRFTPELMKKLVKWYKENTVDLFKILGVDTTITKIEYQGNKIKMTIETLDMDGTNIMMVNVVSPDDEGNYPIRYKGQNFIISGNETQALKSLKPI